VNYVAIAYRCWKGCFKRAQLLASESFADGAWIFSVGSMKLQITHGGLLLRHLTSRSFSTTWLPSRSVGRTAREVSRWAECHRRERQTHSSGAQVAWS